MASQNAKVCRIRIWSEVAQQPSSTGALFAEVFPPHQVAGGLDLVAIAGAAMEADFSGIVTQG